MTHHHHHDELTRRVDDLTATVAAMTRRLSMLENAMQQKAPGLWPNPRDDVKQAGSFDVYGGPKSDPVREIGEEFQGRGNR